MSRRILLFGLLTLGFTPLLAQIEPTTQASNLIITQPFATTLQLNWTNGNGTSRMVVGRQWGSVNQAPVDTQTYGASSTFSEGEDLSGGNYVVYNGSGNSVTVTSVQAGNFYEFFIFEYNGTTGSQNYLVSTGVENPVSHGTPDTTTPEVTLNNTPDKIAPNVNLVVSANFTDAPAGVSYAEIEYRPIAGAAPNDFITVDMVNTVGNTFEYTIPANEVTELGVEYRYLVTDAADNDNSTNQTLYKTRIRHEEGLPIPYPNPGRDVSNYRIIAIPLELDNKSVNSVLGDELGSYDPTKWIMYQLVSGTRFEELSGTTQIVPGKGYWFLASKSVELNSGPGTTLDVSASSPYQITLASGWNQIGNPYNFSISWPEVVLNNPAAALGTSQVRVYRGLVEDVDVLKKLEGGFVKNPNTNSVTITIPVANPGLSGRENSAASLLTNSLDQPDWEVLFNLKAGNSEYKLGGFGMRQDANVGFDFYDDFNLPRFFEYLEIKYPKERVGMTYTKDIVPTAENFVWEFTVESNATEDLTSLHWDNSYFGDGKEIFLLDVAQHKITDMRLQNQYAFNRSGSKEFKVVFGDEEFLKQELLPPGPILYDPYPNPFTDRVSVGYMLPGKVNGTGAVIEIINSIGARISGVHTYLEGVGNWDWNSEEQAPGMYLVRLKVGDQTVTKKIIKR